jgi:hypothetical protein
VPAPASPPTSNVGDHVALGLPGGSGAWLAADDASWDEMIGAQNANSRALMDRLVQRGTVVCVPSGTRAVVVKNAFASRFVRVTNGPREGFEGWVQSEFVAPAP